MKLMFKLWLVVFVIQGVDGYARMVEPPNRSSLWREGVSGVRVNYRDYSINCGGEQVRYIPGLKYWCGVCGDPIYGAQSHTYGGNFVRRYVVSRLYPPNSRYITVHIETNHRHGNFEFKLCPHDFSGTAVNNSCFEKFPLEIKGFGDRYPVVYSGLHTLKLIIPAKFYCIHCILRWRFITANYSKDCYGYPIRRMCIHPEEYYNCADIAIAPGADIPIAIDPNAGSD